MAQPTAAGGDVVATGSGRSVYVSPGETLRRVIIKSGTPYADRSTCGHMDPDHSPWPGYLIGPTASDAPAGPEQQIDHIDFSGNTVFSRDQLLARILSKEPHWYRLFSADYLSFRGPAQSRALLEVKGVIAREDFGYSSTLCGPNEFGTFKRFSRVRDFIQFRDFILSSEDSYNADIVGVDTAIIELNYWRRGYMDVEVKAPALTAASGDGDKSLTFKITEGQRYRFGKIAFETDIAGYDPEDLRYAVDIKEGEWFDSIRVNDIAANLDSVKFSSLPLFKALREHLPFGVCVYPGDEIDETSKVVDVTFAVTRCTAGDGKYAFVHAKPAGKPASLASGLDGRQPGAAHRKPARQVGGLPGQRIGMASADGTGSR